MYITLLYNILNTETQSPNYWQMKKIGTAKTTTAISQLLT